MQINIRTNFPEVAAKLARLQDGMASQVLARSLNRTVEQAKTQMSREIRQEFSLPAAYVSQRLRVRRAFAKAGQFSLAAELIGGDGKRRSANVIRFLEGSTSLAEGRARAKAGTQGRLFVRIKRGKKQPMGRGTFIGNKGRTVFRRTGKARLPIEPVQTIDVAQMFNTRRINAAVVSALQAKFPAIFERELAYAMRSAGL